MTGPRMPLYLALVFLLAAFVLSLVGGAWGHGAAAPIGGAFGLVVGYLANPRTRR